MTVRHALYWAPEDDHPLWAAGCAWLGRDPRAAEAGTAPPGREAPWRYGFHATLKAPFALAEGVDEARLEAAVEALAMACAPFALDTLHVGALADFAALRLRVTPPALQALADRAVVELDPLRRPMPPAEGARRAKGLDDFERKLLERWGYPHVLSQWRFHMTLTDPLPDPGARACAMAEADAHFAAALRVPLTVRSVCVFVEPAPAAPLRLSRRFALGAGR